MELLRLGIVRDMHIFRDAQRCGDLRYLHRRFPREEITKYTEIHRCPATNKESVNGRCRRRGGGGLGGSRRYFE